jgi:hypothetical protein
MDLHPVEAGWRRLRSGPHADLLRKSLEARSSYLRFIHMARLPNEIVLPGAVAWNLVALGERARGERTGPSISIEGSVIPISILHLTRATLQQCVEAAASTIAQ